MRKKMFKVLCIAGILCLSATFPTYAEWISDNGSWRWQNTDGTYAENGWQWIDSNSDGIAECYYFDNGILLINAKTPDGYQVNKDGAWIKDNVVQTKSVLEDTQSTSSVQRDKTAAKNLFNEQEFLNTYRDYLDTLISYSQEDNNITVLTEMEKIKYEQLLVNLYGNTFCYPSDTGIGLKIQNNYLYYGELVNGKAEGHGKAYNANISKKRNAERYGYFVGEWHNDAPNGSGEEFSYLNNGISTNHIKGNYVNWYQDGDMTCSHYSHNKVRTLHYTVVNKFPVAIDTKVNKQGTCTVVAYPEEQNGGYLTFYDTAQTAAHINISDGISKNAYGYWNMN